MRNKVELIRDDRYDVKAFRICPFDVIIEGNDTVLHPEGELYGSRIGVLDKAKNIVIEMETKCSYIFIDAKSYGWVNSTEIIPGNRYAYLPTYLGYNDLTQKDIKKINGIIEDLRCDRKFLNGNDVYSNQEYLNVLDDITLKNELDKINDSKRLFKRKMY